MCYATPKNEAEMEDAYYLSLALDAAKKSTCLRRQVGAVAVDKNGRVWGTGYNGAPDAMPRCTSDLCVRMRRGIPSGSDLHLCRAVHAEQRLLNQFGLTLRDCSVYITNQPCSTCFKLLLQAGVERIIWGDKYNNPFTIEMMYECGNITVHKNYSEFILRKNY